MTRSIARVVRMVLLAVLFAGCSGLSLTPEPLPTLFVLPTLTPVPATPTPQPIAEPPVATETPQVVADVPTAVPTTAEIECDDTEGQVVEATYESSIVQGEVPYLIYLPPCYEATGRRYPVLYILHGLGEGMNHTQWDEMGLDEAADVGYRRGALPPMIIVMPDGTGHIPSDPFNTVHGMNYFSPTTSYEYMIFSELMPQVEAAYCTWNAREGRAIGGLSRGGFWAYEIAMRHPELFSAVGGHSAAFYEDSSIPAANNPLDLASSADGLDGLRMYLDHGVGDYDWVEEAITAFSDRLTTRGIAHTYVVNPVGAHNEAYWSSHTADYLSFYAAEWPREANELPACGETAG